MAANKAYPQDTNLLEKDSTSYTTQQANTSGASPPAYTSIAPDITAAFSNLTLSNETAIPSPDECIAHLKLLEAFSQLREDVGTTDGLYGIRDDFVPVAMAEERRVEVLAKMREKRWAIYVTNAVNRFQTYWQKCIQPDATMIKQGDLDEKWFVEISEQRVPLSVSKDALPPLDLIMVWHAYMLNPRQFFADCARSRKIRFWAMGMPWALINSVIDNSTFEYNPGNDASKSFVAKTGLHWNNLDDSTRMKLSCPACRHYVIVPFTTCNNQESWTAENSGEMGTGFTEKNFRAICSQCSFPLDHNVMRAQKFRGDLSLLLLQDCPMPGTFLDLDGMLLRMH